MNTHIRTLSSPLGPLDLVEADGALIALRFGDSQSRRRSPLLDDAAAQLRAFFAGERLHFDLPLAPTGTPFQLECWRATSAIPAGQTLSYAELAAQIGRPKAIRAVGAAMARNPLPIIVPCHRVVGSRGALTGYIGGLERKRWLLDFEAAQSSATASSSISTRQAGSSSAATTTIVAAGCASPQ